MSRIKTKTSVADTTREIKVEPKVSKIQIFLKGLRIFWEDCKEKPEVGISSWILLAGSLFSFISFNLITDTITPFILKLITSAILGLIGAAALGACILIGGGLFFILHDYFQSVRDRIK